MALKHPYFIPFFTPTLYQTFPRCFQNRQVLALSDCRPGDIVLYSPDGTRQNVSLQEAQTILSKGRTAPNDCYRFKTQDQYQQLPLDAVIIAPPTRYQSMADAVDTVEDTGILYWTAINRPPNPEFYKLWDDLQLPSNQKPISAGSVNAFAHNNIDPYMRDILNTILYSYARNYIDACAEYISRFETDDSLSQPCIQNGIVPSRIISKRALDPIMINPMMIVFGTRDGYNVMIGDSWSFVGITNTRVCRITYLSSKTNQTGKLNDILKKAYIDLYKGESGLFRSFGEFFNYFQNVIYSTVWASLPRRV
jgi:hypothetical protein